MTPQELRNMLIPILRDYMLGNRTMEQTLETIEILHTAAQPPAKNTYYDFLNTLDRNYTAIKQAEGNPGEELKMIDLMMSTLAARAEYVKKTLDKGEA